MRFHVFVVVALCACNATKKDVVPAASASAAVASASAAPSAKPKPQLPPAPTAPLTVTIDGKDTALSHALAFVNDGTLKVVAAGTAIGCEDYESKFGNDDERVALEMDMPPGPERKYFVGHRVGVPGQIQAPGISATYINQNQLVVELDAADAKAGAHVRGWAIWTRGALGAKGTFDAKVCPAASSEAPAALGTDATGDVSGSIGGETFQTKKALAVVRHDKDTDADYLSELDFFAHDDVGCDGVPANDAHTPSLAITKIGGASAKNDLTGTLQPAEGMYAPTGWKIGRLRVVGGGWIQLDALDLAGPMKGTLRVATPKGTAGGAFTADVCRK